MKLLKLTICGLPNFKDTLDLDFVAQQRVNDRDKEKLYNVFSNIYVNEAISFIGINASGKTTILKAVSFAVSLLNNEAINSIETKEILDDLQEGQTITLTAYFYANSLVSKLETIISKKINDLDGSAKFIITDERLWSKDSQKIKLKKNLFEFSDSELKIRRDQKEQFLMEDVSIIIAVNKENDSHFFLHDMLRWTNHNIIGILGRFPKELLMFLDPSIEYLRGDVNDKVTDIQLKFYGKEEISINNPLMLEHYLSSGTIKGLTVFMNALFSFYEGGYLLIDEIENHFNEEIVVTLVRFFLDKKVNKNGATIIFSTHYSELIDEFERNDGIYIVRNRGGIEAEKLSNILKRNDIKKSEAYDSGFLEGTVPAYEAYMRLKKNLAASIPKEAAK